MLGVVVVVTVVAITATVVVCVLSIKPGPPAVVHHPSRRQGQAELAVSAVGAVVAGVIQHEERSPGTARSQLVGLLRRDTQ